jgi:hypothetical protein
MVIISVTAGSVIVELGFLRIDGATSSPTELVLRLKTAATSGQLDKFGLTALSVGSESVIDDSGASLSSGAIVGAVLGSILGAICLSFVVFFIFRRMNPAKVSPSD